MRFAPHHVIPRVLSGALVAVLMAGSAIAKPIPKPTPLHGVVVGSVQEIEGTSAGENCTAGQPGPARTFLDFIYPNDDYFTTIRVADCAGCAGATAMVFDQVRFQLYFPTICPDTIQVSAVGSVGTASCPFPDAGTIRCPARTFVITPPEANAAVEFTLPIPPCMIEDRAFLQIRFVNWSAPCDSGTRPRLVLTQAACTQCRSYNDFTGVDEVPDDLCGIDPVGNPIMNVVVDSCFVFHDVIPPARITDLQWASITTNEVNLTWLASGDDGMAGRAASYDIRRATFPLDSLNFTSGDSLVGTPTPRAPGQRDFYLATGLTENTTYYFAIRAIDDGGNVGPISNILVATPGGGAPGRVLDLRVVETHESRITLAWTATGDDGPLGHPTSYIIAVSTQPIDDAAFYSARLDTLIATSLAGQTEATEIEDLESGTRYWFAVKARDNNDYLSPISNVVNQQTRTSGPLPTDGVAIASQFQPTRTPVVFYWQSGTATPSGEQAIRIYDATGRFIRVFGVGNGSNGVLQWNGRDYEGRLVPAGLYLARFITGSSHAQARVILLR